MRLFFLICVNLIVAAFVCVYLAAGWSEVPLSDDARSKAPGVFLETSQGRLHYRWHGPEDGPVIVMAHGYSTPNFIFDQNAEALVGAGYRVLTYDHFGRGWSDRPTARYDDAFYERELLDLLDGLGLTDPVGLVGLSMGGVTTSYFTANNPDRVSSLFLFVPAGFVTSQNADSALHKLIMTPVLGDWIWRVFGRQTLQGDDQYDETGRTPENRLRGDVSEQMAYAGYFRALLSSYRHTQMFDRDAMYQKLAQTGIPVMAVFGAQDEVVLPASLPRFEAAMPNARAVMIEGGEHGLNYQMAAEANALLLDFFADAPAELITAASLSDDLLGIYHHLHAHPEPSFLENDTQDFLAEEMRALGFEVTTGLGDAWVKAKAARDQGVVHDGVGGYGLVAVLENGPGPTVLLRTDMDALPLLEKTGKTYASKVIETGWTGQESPIMHACGHDVHMTSWIGTARALVDRRADWSGTLVMIAQPAEELGLGAQALLADGLYERFPKPDANLALHVAADLPAGIVGYTEGYALANVDSVDIHVKGTGGHGAYPHTTRDPIIIGAHIVTALQTLVSRNIDPRAPAVVTVGSLTAGTKHNIISDEAHLKLTVRSYDDGVRQALLNGIKRIAEGQAASFGAPLPEVIVESDATPSTYNDPELTRRSMAAISDTIGPARVRAVSPSMGGEDFSQYSRTEDKIPSLIFWIGTVDPGLYQAAKANGTPLPPLHSPLFAPDAGPAIQTGIHAMTAATVSAFKDTPSVP